MNPYYKDYAEFLSGFFEGKVQKLSVDLGFGCPNRDGTIGTGGCIYCNNKAFSPDWDKRDSGIGVQLAKGRDFFARKYPKMRYLAYFQSYTGTHAAAPVLYQAYNEALDGEDIVGIIIGTRPDCMPDEILTWLADVNSGPSGKKVFVEFGAESSHDATLARINRCHTWNVTVDATRRVADAGIPVGLHFILGLPGESEEMMLETVHRVNRLPVSTVKFHQLQVLEGTPLARAVERGEYDDRIRFTPESYADLCARIVGTLRKDIAIERFLAQAPPGMLVEPRWGLKNYQFVSMLDKRLAFLQKCRSRQEN